MSNRPNTRWGARQPPRRGGYDQNYPGYNYDQQYSASGYEYEYESYDQSQPNYDRQSGSSKRYPANRNNYESGNNYYHNPPPRFAKGNQPETNKNNSSVSKKAPKKAEAELNSPVLNKEPTEPIGRYLFFIFPLHCIPL